jgi:hypothetical protein
MPGPEPTPSPGASPASPVRLLGVEVTPSHRGHFAQVPGTGSGTHWVGVASASEPKPVVAAVLDPAVAAGDPRVAGLTWSGPGVTPTGNPLEAGVDRTAGERRVTATLDGVSASTTLWSVFAVIRASYGPLPFWIANPQLPDQLIVGGRVKFEATIFPASILGSGDRPVLEGPNDTAPPGGTRPFDPSQPLSKGADHHWDFSRKSSAAHTMSRPLVPGDPEGQALVSAMPWSYPGDWEEGNDDSDTVDEHNDPYAGPMTSEDQPSVSYHHRVGSDGDTVELRINFMEFVRLEIARTWWVVSHPFPWRVKLRLLKEPGRWRNGRPPTIAEKGND